ncbi:MAG: S8 family serine peptidase [Actinomycetota bacterium]|nr:S8 family serine peptidase [Actinomycetota bacterium]
MFAEDEGTAQIQAGNLQGGVPTPGYEAFLAARELSGEGVVVSISDTGIDDRHPEHQGRVVTKINYTTAPSSPDTGGHGTHVAGIVGGYGATFTYPQGITNRPEDHEGFLLGVGVAPKVRFVDQSIIPGGSFVGGAPASFERYSADAVRAGAVAWNASWNTGAANSGYVARARSLDMVTRDADFDADGGEPFTMVFSAGNSGPGARTITQPKEAKNIITVGSTYSQRVLPASASGADTVSSFSSRGPTRDGRIAPTVAAPGQDVVSSTSSSAGGSCTFPTSAGGAVPFAAGAVRYSTCSGTSMAEPQVTGAVALFDVWWRKANDGADPSPAMSKALLVNSATDMGTPNIPNGDEGWGRVNLGALFDHQASRVYLDQSVVFTDFDQAHEIAVTPADPSKPFKVTLTWSDAPAAAGASRTLVNDLDLHVIAPDGSSYAGNAFSMGWSVADAGTPDRLNNVENVFTPAAQPGTYQVRVSAYNVPGSAVPDSEELASQDFALVISNARVAG